MALRHVIRDTKNFFNIGKLRKQLEFDRWKSIIEQETLNNTEPGISDERYCNNEIVVSLTSYGKRVETVYLAIASMMRQSLKPNRIVLWLGEEFKDKRLPATLRLLQKRGLEIRFCKDIRSYTKLIPSLEEFPDAAIITIDDDMIYDFELVDRLIRAHIMEPKTVWCLRMTEITFGSNGEIAPYKRWTPGKTEHESPMNFATGVGGILYPPHIFTDEILDREKFMSLAPTADDLWFKAMEITSGVKVKKIPTKNPSGEDYISGIVPHSEGLAGHNVDNGGNDATIRALSSYFDLLPR